MEASDLKKILDDHAVWLRSLGARGKKANLSSANLSYANLSYADLSHIRDDFFKVLDIARAEAIGLYDALMRGKVDGTCYEGDCACLVGTIANIRCERYNGLTIDLKPNAGRPAERWFTAILRGHTPQSSEVAQITAEWMIDWSKKNEVEFPEYEIVSILEKPESP